MLRRNHDLEDDNSDYWSNTKGFGADFFSKAAATKALGDLEGLRASVDDAPPPPTGSDSGSSGALDEAPSPVPPRPPLLPPLGSSASLGPAPARPHADSLSPARPRKASHNAASSVCSGSSFDDRGSVGTSPAPRREFTSADHSRLDSEYRKLLLKYETARRDRYRPPEIRESIQRLLRGETAVLSLYKSREEKTQLLDAALKSGDGHVLTEVVVYLRESLSMRLFQDLLVRQPVAADHYAAFLRDHGKWDELRTVLTWLGRREEAAMVLLRQALRLPDPAAKLAALKKALEGGLAAEPSLISDVGLVQDYIKLLEVQIPVDAEDEKNVKVGREQKWIVYPKATSLVDQPVLTTLYYSCLYHYELPPNSFASPLFLKATQRLSEKQFTWVAVRALSRQHRWQHIRDLLTSKALTVGRLSLGPTKLRSPVPWPKLLEAMAKHGATAEVLEPFISAVGDADERLACARKFQAHKAALDCFVAAKDRLGLIEYNARHITQHTKESLYASTTLQNSNIRWKN